MKHGLIVYFVYKSNPPFTIQRAEHAVFMGGGHVGGKLHDDLMMLFPSRGSIHVIMLYGEGEGIITTFLVSHGLRSMVCLFTPL